MTIVTPFIKKLLSEKFKCTIFKEIKKKIVKGRNVMDTTRDGKKLKTIQT